jgi:hypothetical protein
MSVPKGWKARKKRNDANPAKQAAKAARIAREKHDAPRQAALSQPITAEQHVNYKKHLLAIPHGMGECWIHVSKSTTGRTKTYTKVKYNGYWVPAHRFALAVKLGCTRWDLEGFNAGHAPAWVCMGGRCCNPGHLRKEVTPQGAWSRSADRFENGAKPTRTPEQQERMVKQMHRRGEGGLPTGDMLLGRIATFGSGTDVFQNRVLEPMHTA